MERFLIVLPLMILTVDLFNFPVVIENSTRHVSINLITLLRDHRYDLGRFKAHDFLISIGDISSHEFLDQLSTSTPNALVVSGFVDDPTPGQKAVNSIRSCLAKH